MEFISLSSFKIVDGVLTPKATGSSEVIIDPTIRYLPLGETGSSGGMFTGGGDTYRKHPLTRKSPSEKMPNTTFTLDEWVGIILDNYPYIIEYNNSIPQSLANTMMFRKKMLGFLQAGGVVEYKHIESVNRIFVLVVPEINHILISTPTKNPSINNLHAGFYLDDTTYRNYIEQLSKSTTK